MKIPYETKKPHLWDQLRNHLGDTATQQSVTGVHAWPACFRIHCTCSVSPSSSESWRGTSTCCVALFLVMAKISKDAGEIRGNAHGFPNMFVCLQPMRWTLGERVFKGNRTSLHHFGHMGHMDSNQSSKSILLTLDGETWKTKVSDRCLYRFHCLPMNCWWVPRSSPRSVSRRIIRPDCIHELSIKHGGDFLSPRATPSVIVHFERWDVP